MTEPHSQNSNLYARVGQARKFFESTRLVYEAGDLASAKILAARAIAALLPFIDEFNNDKGLLENLSLLGEDQKKLSREDGIVKDQEQHMLYVLDHLKKSIWTLERAFDSIHRHESVSSRILVRYIRPLAFIIAMFAIGYLFINAFRWVRIWHHGLFGEYYKDVGLTKYSFSRIDKMINFSWVGEPPAKRFKTENYSIRWTGFLKAPESGAYQLSTESDDGVRLWVDDKMLIDHWMDHAVATDQTLLDLTAGNHPIKIEYFQRGGGAIIRLFWKYGSMSEPEIIPPQALTPSHAS